MGCQLHWPQFLSADMYMPRVCCPPAAQRFWLHPVLACVAPLMGQEAARPASGRVLQVASACQPAGVRTVSHHIGLRFLPIELQTCPLSVRL
jgi:hypothetical protein